MRFASFRPGTVLTTVAVLLLGTFILDILTPLGYAEWCAYFIGVGATLFQPRRNLPYAAAAAASVLLALGAVLSPPGMAAHFAYINRGIGLLSFWTMAVVASSAIRSREDARSMLWLQESQNVVRTALQGDLSANAVASQALRALGDRLDATLGAIYRLDGDALTLVGGIALAPNQPQTIPSGSGLLGEAVQVKRARRFTSIAPDHLRIHSSLGHSQPAELLLSPLTADGDVVGAIELGRLLRATVADTAALALLESSAETVGIALRSALLREQLQELLAETQAQSEELQAQQEELRVANEELEEQSRALQQSQAALETSSPRPTATSPSSWRTCPMNSGRRSTAR
jgi:Arc/MetJ-type ribon-helix-helix transcriptional regulator